MAGTARRKSTDRTRPGRRLRIFISYRREDSLGYARDLYQALSEQLPESQIFWDIGTIEPGVDFVDAIEQAVGSCDVLLAVIGRQWLAITDAQGQRKLDDPCDFVRLEVATALERNIRVVPVLVQGAPILKAELLPDALSTLARRHSFELSDSRWAYDLDQLAAALGLGRAAPKGQPAIGLADLMRTPEAYAAVAQYRSSFQTVCRQINMVADYKELHDELDELQRRCYDPLAKQWSFPNVVEAVAEHAYDLDEITETIDSIIRHGHVTDQESWVNSLKRAGATFRDAIEQTDIKKLGAVKLELQRILARQPSHINELICHEARRLDLSLLLDSLSALWDRIAQSSGDSGKLQIIEQNLAELRRLDADRVTLVDAHNRWQEIEDELRRIENQPDLGELELAWAYLKERLQEQCEGCIEEWADRLWESTHRLEGAMALDSANQIRHTFNSLRWQARKRFYQIDDELLELCDKRLRPLGEELRVVLTVIG